MHDESQESARPTAIAAENVQLRSNRSRGMLIAGRGPFGALHVWRGPDTDWRCLKRGAREVSPVCCVSVAVLRQRAQLLLVRLCQRPPVWLHRQYCSDLQHPHEPYKRLLHSILSGFLGRNFLPKTAIFNFPWHLKGAAFQGKECMLTSARYGIGRAAIQVR